MLGLAFSLPAALNLLWGLVSDQGVDALHRQIQTRARARRVAKVAADCIGRTLSNGTVDVSKLRQILVSQSFVDWLRSGRDQDAQLADSQLDELAGTDEIVSELLRREIAICVVEAFEAVVSSEDVRVAVLLSAIRKADGKLRDEMARNSGALEQRLDTIQDATQSTSHVLKQGLEDLHRRFDELQDNQSILLEILKRSAEAHDESASGFRASYQAEIRQYEEFHQNVRGRGDDLAFVLERLDEISTSNLVLVGAAWAGKTAFVVKLRMALEAAGWRTVIYFWREGQSDTDHFLDIVNTQLLVILGSNGGVPLRWAEKRAQFNALWERAIAQPRPLALIVDGFDEQPEDFPLARLMPRTFGLSGRVIVSTRPHPDPSTGVDPTHPLASAEHTIRVQLAVSPYATVQQHAAERATRRLLREEPAVAGLLAVAPALSVDELADLLGEKRTPGQLRDCVAGSARHLERLTDSAGQERLRWAHAALLREVTGWFGAQRASLVQEIVGWCDKYQAQGWPPHTPEWCLRYLDAFVGNEGIDPFRWLQPERRERMIRSLLHLGPYLDGISIADEHLRQDGRLDSRLDLAAEYIDAFDRAIGLPASVYTALRLAGRGDAAREAVEERPGGQLADPLGVDEPPSVHHVDAVEIAYAARQMVDGIKQQQDPFRNLRLRVEDRNDLCDWFVALAWAVDKFPYNGIEAGKLDELTGKLADRAIAAALDVRRATGLDVLETIAGQLAVSQVELAAAIAARHPRRNRVALSLAENQDQPRPGVELPSAVASFPPRSVPPAEADAHFRLIAPLVDDDPATLAELCYNAVRWAPRQAAELALRVVSSYQDRIERVTLYGLVQALAPVDPARARWLADKLNRDYDDQTVGGRLLALGVVDDQERFETATAEAIRGAKEGPRDPLKTRDWILSDAIGLLALRNAPRALAMFRTLQSPRYIGLAAGQLTHKLDPGNPALASVADQVEQAIHDTGGSEKVLVRFGLGAISLVDPRHALQVLERWSITDDMLSYPGYEAIGRLALSDLDSALESVKHLRYPWNAQEAIARHLAQKDPENSLRLCADIRYADIRARARARVASTAQSDTMADRGFGRALDAFMVSTDTDTLAVIAGSMATSQLNSYREVGAQAIDRLSGRWATLNDQYRT